MRLDKTYIGGVRRDAEAVAEQDIINPATGAHLGGRGIGQIILARLIAGTGTFQHGLAFRHRGLTPCVERSLRCSDGTITIRRTAQSKRAGRAT
jgi:hypothetical protein